LYEKFQQVRKYLQDKLPSVDKIIRADIDISSKADLVELYEILMTTEPTTIEWICLRDEINEQFDIAIVKYRDYLTLTDEQKQAIEYTKNVIHRDASWVMEQQIACLPLKKEHKDLVWEKYLRMAKMDSSGEEWGKINEWISVVLKIPWCESSGGGEDFIERPQHTYLSNPVEIQLKNIYNQLNSEFYGLEKVKDSILMYVNNRLRGGGENIKGSGGCLALLGASGTGKTSIARSISKILNLPFSQISCDALSKNSLVGHSYTYIGSQCGFIVKSLIDMKTSNGVIFLDEIDKISDEKNLGGLLNIIDPSQNSTFKDAYIGTIPIDLSQVWFICSMNKLPENKALLDRLHVINISGYTRQNKLDILKNHTFRKLEKTSALNFNVSDAIFNLIIDKSKEESGVRMCEFMLKHLMTTLEFMWQKSRRFVVSQ
jgi:ATP-dependent Lon protease